MEGFVWAAASLMGVSPADEGDALTVEGFGRADASTTMDDGCVDGGGCCHSGDRLRRGSCEVNGSFDG